MEIAQQYQKLKNESKSKDEELEKVKQSHEALAQEKAQLEEENKKTQEEKAKTEASLAELKKKLSNKATPAQVQQLAQVLKRLSAFKKVYKKSKDQGQQKVVKQKVASFAQQWLDEKLL